MSPPASVCQGSAETGYPEKTNNSEETGGRLIQDEPDGPPEAAAPPDAEISYLQ